MSNNSRNKKNDTPNPDILEGRNPIFEALSARREMNQILVAKGSREKSIQKIVDLAREMGVVIKFVDKAKIDSISTSDNHQGIVAYVAAHKYYDLSEIMSDEGESLVIVCDEINDPHNLGSIMRTANAVGAHGIIIPKRRSVALTPTVGKTSAGAMEYTKVARVSNLNNAIDELKENGYWIVAADMDGQVYHKQDLTGKIALVVGNEGKGVSHLTKKKCDFIVSLPMLGQVNSLNASVAASILMYEVIRQRDVKGKN